MTITMSPIRTAALALDAMERESLAEELLLSLSQEEQDSIDAAWLAEVHRREAALAAGKTGCKPVGEVIGRIGRRVGK